MSNLTPHRSSIVVRRLLLLLLCLLLTTPLPGQGVPDSLLVSALTSRTCVSGDSGPNDTASVTLRFFPSIHFLRGRCILEHGSPSGAIVGSDSSGVLYLLGDETGLDFLIDRHPPGRIGAKDRVEYAAVVLELAGRITNRAIVLDSVGQIPEPARKALGKMAADFSPRSWGDSIKWGASLITSTLTFDGERIERWQVETIWGDHPYVFDTLETWYGPPITRFSIPRTGPDSLLARAARDHGRDYGTMYAAA
ncbi:MAG TPA: hypothetical protein VMJ30_06455, partial [Gemmatimonadales bacterium]|nr:hypothetical protein [Gemmatimonadales bacterium]